MNLSDSNPNHPSILNGVQQWCKSACLLCCIPTKTLLANASFPETLDQSALERLKKGCLLPIDGLDLDIKQGARVLVLGAGGGDEVLRFIRNGFDCIGLEPDRAYARRTKVVIDQMGEDPEIIQQSDGIDMPVNIGSFDLIIFSHNYYSRLIGSAKRVAILKSLHKHLKPTGKIYFEFEMRPDSGKAMWHYRLPFPLIRIARLLFHWNQPKLELGIKLDANPHQLTHHFVRHEIIQEMKSASLAIDELFTGSAGSVLCRRRCPLTKEPANLERRVLEAVSL